MFMTIIKVKLRLFKYLKVEILHSLYRIKNYMCLKFRTFIMNEILT